VCFLGEDSTIYDGKGSVPKKPIYSVGWMVSLGERGMSSRKEEATLIILAFWNSLKSEKMGGGGGPMGKKAAHAPVLREERRSASEEIEGSNSFEEGRFLSKKTSHRGEPSITRGTRLGLPSLLGREEGELASRGRRSRVCRVRRTFIRSRSLFSRSRAERQQIGGDGKGKVSVMDRRQSLGSEQLLSALLPSRSSRIQGYRKKRKKEGPDARQKGSNRGKKVTSRQGAHGIA